MRLSALILTLLVLVRPASAQSSPQLHWYRCNTHTHSNAFPGSDANASPEFIAEWYRSHGYQCVVITDHEHLTDVTAVNQKYAKDRSFLVMKGEEITQILSHTRPEGNKHLHVNGIHLDKLEKPILPVGYPEPARGMTPAQLYERNIGAIRAGGGIPQVNHPNGSFSVRAEDLMTLNGPFLMEIWNAFPTIGNLGGTDDAGNVIPPVEGLWDTLLSRGKVVWGVASDDVHDYYKFDDPYSPTPGKAWIVIQAAELTETALTNALRKGQFYASTGVTLETYSADEKGILLKLDPPFAWNQKTKAGVLYKTRFIGVNGRVLAEASGLSASYTFKGDEQYVRASIIDSDGRRAWTQPVFLDKRKATE